jgi:2-oxoglutarate ferredoxin oxidoreductase subunit delta
VYIESGMKTIRKNMKVHRYEVVPVSGKRPANNRRKITIKLNIERCKGCGLCVDVCPRDNLRLSEKINSKGHHYIELIELNNCTGCGLCYQMCPDLVIEIETTPQRK